MGINTDIQQSILSSFLFANDTGDNVEKAFVLDESVFTTPLTLRIAQKINEETKSDRMYGFQLISMENDLIHTKHAMEWIEIIAQTPIPLTVASRLHSKLILKAKQRIAMGV